MPKPKKPVDSAAELIPDHPTISSVRDAAKECQACDLYKRGTQTVFGEGARRAELMFVGEAPGAEEDRQVERLHIKQDSLHGFSGKRCP